MRRLGLLIVLLGSAGALAQPADESVGEVRALLAAGDSAAAYRVVTAAVRRQPDDAALRRIRLALNLAGVGVRGVPRFLRQQQIADAAGALLRRAPRDTLALRVLVDDAIWTVLGWHDRVQPGAIRSVYGDFVSQEEVRARLAQSRFDMEARRAMAPDLDQSGRAREAHEQAVGWIETWLAEAPGAARAYEAALTLAVVTETWDGALTLARQFQAASDDLRADLYAGLALYRSGDAAASEAAFDRALARLADAERARYEDVRMLLPLDRRAAYDADPEAVAREFWTTADPRLLTEANERIAEHRARVVEADLLFGWTAGDLFTLVRPRGAETEQGRLWVRYGRPASTVRFVLDDDAAPAYSTPADRFADRRFTVWDYPDFTFVFEDPENDGRYRTYSPPASAFSRPNSSAINDDFVIQDREMQRTDPERSQDAPEIPLVVPALVSRFRAHGGDTDLVVAWGVPLDSVVVPVRTGAFVLTPEGIADRALQEHRQLAAGRIVRTEGGRVWTEAAQLRLAGAGTVRVEVEGSAGRAFGSATEAVAPLSGGGLSMSDLLLATSIGDDGGLVRRGGVGIVPAPQAAFAPADPIYVYLEAYGLGLDAGRSRYTVEAALRPEARRGGLLGRIFGRGQGPGVAVRTEAEGDRSDEAVTFFVDVRDQRPGRYTLTVTVADAVTGATASAQREVVLLEGR